jgi:hypothetical protein
VLPIVHTNMWSQLTHRIYFQVCEGIVSTRALDELSKVQREKLIPAGEIFDVAIALISIGANLKLVGRKEVRQL